MAGQFATEEHQGGKRYRLAVHQCWPPVAWYANPTQMYANATDRARKTDFDRLPWSGISAL
jgi:hypothetical protein